ncbi:malonic semialdehyde reductase [uncultured Tateyamaria sp.]|uniref:malonic semialdehyde reductase n=1 Tax=uncultured Tateyamaria sp. TaxID=455651 RepID=UPI00260619C6|nr:malonic semialdehyde reductase [uncultured Tateyamaria sp.]
MDTDKLDAQARNDVRDLRERILTADPATLDLLLRDGRTHYGFQDRDVSDDTLKELYDLAKWGPTSMNQQPGRFVFVRSADAKEKLRPALMEPNQAKMMSAPVTAIIAFDTEFYEQLPAVFPPNPNARDMFAGNPEMAAGNAFRNGSMQGAYFLIAARALGLDTGPMSGFNPAAVDEAFLSGTTWKTNFLCNLGYGDEEKLFRRLPRLPFDDVAKII